MDDQIYKPTKDLASHIIPTKTKRISWKNSPKQKLEHEFRVFQKSNVHRGVTFSNNGKFIASGNNDQTILWDYYSGKRLRSESTGWWESGRLSFTPDDKFLIVNIGPEDVSAWNLALGGTDILLEYQETEIAKEDTIYNTIAFTRDCQFIAVGSNDSTIEIWKMDSEKWNLLKKLKMHSEILSIAFSMDGKYFLSASSDKTLRLWKTSNWKGVWIEKYGNTVNSVSFSPTDNNVFAAGYGDGTVSIWRIPNPTWYVSNKKPTEILKLSSHLELGYIEYLAFSPNGKKIGVASMSKFSLWETETGELLHFLEDKEHFTMHNFTFSPNNKILISIDYVGRLHYWDLITFNLLAINHQPDSGFLYSIPPDEYFPESLFWTDRADLITVYAEKPDGTREVASDKERDCYIDTHNRKLLVQPRLCGDLKKYEDLVKSVHMTIEGYNNQIALESKYFHQIAIEVRNSYE